MTEYAAVLWDLDGTIVDTEPLWIGAEHELAEAYGRTWTTEDALQLVGSDLLVAGEIIRTKLNLPIDKTKIVDHLMTRVIEGLSGDVPWRPGAVELIRELAAAGIPQALVTMSWTAIAEPIARTLPFDAVVTGDIVSRGKPHPEPYLLAAERLGADARACLAVEDSPTGATSANAAGCWVLAVPHAVPVPDADRRAFLPSLHEVTVRDLSDLFSI